MNEIMNVVVMIGIFGKSLNYKGDSAQNFICVLLLYVMYVVLYSIVLLFNLEFSLKYQSHYIMNYYM